MAADTSFEIQQEIILRTPYLPACLIDEQQLVRLIEQDFFRSAIYIASRSLYDEIAGKNFDLNRLPVKCIDTLNNYANRMAFRTTPFGVFAGFSIVSKKSNSCIIISDEGAKVHITPEFAYLNKIYRDLISTADIPHLLGSNASVYFSGTDIRYYTYEETGDKRVFSVKKIKKEAYLVRILNYCKTGRTPAELLLFLESKCHISEDHAEPFIADMVAAQLLVSSLAPNITGEDFYEKLTQLADAEGAAAHDELPVNVIKNQELSIEEFSTLVTVDQEFEKQHSTPVKYYVNLERSVTGGIGAEVYQHLDDAVFALRRLSAAGELASLQSFKEAFQKKFEGHTVSLLVALDLEMGISYEKLAQRKQEVPLIDGLDTASAATPINSIGWGPVQQLLFSKWQTAHPGVIRLTPEDVLSLKEPEQKLPPSFSILFKICGGQVQIDQAGGNSATALLGRFTPLNADILQLSRQIAANEEINNEQVIFAEIAYLCDGHTDNINRRERIREYEIPILTGSEYDANKQIRIQDLYIVLEDNEIRLWCPRLKKRIVPRHSSAFNFQRNELTLFRFLCDLQYQGLQTNLNLDLALLFPGLSFYPRVVYKDCILSPATWLLKTGDITINYNLPVSQQIEQILTYTAAINLPDLFALTRADQYLVFNLKDQQSLVMLLNELGGDKELLLKEIITDNLKPTVTDTKNEGYASQFIASVVNNAPVYDQFCKKPSMTVSKQIPAEFLPGSEWIYFKIYCQPYNTEAILIAVLDTVSKFGKFNFIKQWFFIRYQDPDYHLRIRLNINKDNYGTVCAALNELWGRLTKDLKITRIESATYLREVKRYTPGFITAAEEVFCISTAMILKFYKKNRSRQPAETPLSIAIVVAYDMLYNNITDNAKRLQVIANVKEMLFREFGQSPKLKVGLDQKNRQFKKTVFELLDSTLLFYKRYGMIKERAALHTCLGPLKNIDEQTMHQVLTDVIHMHINRSFTDQMRKQEMVVYSLMQQFEITMSYLRNK